MYPLRKDTNVNWKNDHWKIKLEVVNYDVVMMTRIHRVARLWIGEWPSDMEVSCEYTA